MFYFGYVFDRFFSGDFVGIERQWSMCISDGRYVFVMSVGGGYAHRFDFLVDEVEWVFESNFWIGKRLRLVFM